MWCSVYSDQTLATAQPAIILLDETFVTMPWIHRIALLFAAKNILVFIPDLSTRTNLGRLSSKTLLKLQKEENEATISYIGHGIEIIKQDPRCNGRVACVGFSNGGLLSFLAASYLSLDAAVAYYPTGIAEYLDFGQNVHCQMILHLEHSKMETHGSEHKKIHAALVGKVNFAIYNYEADKGFANTDNKKYQVSAASNAHDRTLKLLEKLKSES